MFWTVARFCYLKLLLLGLFCCCFRKWFLTWMNTWKITAPLSCLVTSEILCYQGFKSMKTRCNFSFSYFRVFACLFLFLFDDIAVIFRNCIMKLIVLCPWNIICYLLNIWNLTWRKRNNEVIHWLLWSNYWCAHGDQYPGFYQLFVSITCLFFCFVRNLADSSINS